MTLQSNDFLLSAYETPTYWPFHLSNLLQMPNDLNGPMLSSSAASHLVVKRISFNDPLKWSLSTSDGQPLHSSSSRLSSPLQNFLNHHCTIHSLAIPGPNALLMLWVISAALWPNLNSNKKITHICFLSNIISIVLKCI